MNKLLSDIAGQGAQNECNFSPWEGGKINAFCAWGGVFFGGEGERGRGSEEEVQGILAAWRWAGRGWVFRKRQKPTRAVLWNGGALRAVAEVRLMLSKADRAHP